jgi:hypothetical protein
MSAGKIRRVATLGIATAALTAAAALGTATASADPAGAAPS